MEAFINLLLRQSHLGTDQQQQQCLMFPSPPQCFWVMISVDQDSSDEQLQSLRL